jgi:hypothetical protein
MSDYRLGNCILCHSDNVEVRYIDLYVIGSEGLNTCRSCEMLIVEFAKKLMLENGRKLFEAKKLARH